jgi:hypothetical protein
MYLCYEGYYSVILNYSGPIREKNCSFLRTECYLRRKMPDCIKFLSSMLSVRVVLRLKIPVWHAINRDGSVRFG